MFESADGALEHGKRGGRVRQGFAAFFLLCLGSMTQAGAVRSDGIDVMSVAGEPPVASAKPACELHVWPSTGLRSTYYGWFHGAIVDGAVDGRKGYPVVPADPIGSAVQAQLLGSLDLGALFRRPDYRIVVHTSAPLGGALNERLAASASPCYAELITQDVFFQQDIITGRYLRTLFRFRDFEGSSAPQRVFGTWTQTGLTAFPPQHEDNAVTAEAELHNAFQANLTMFANYLLNPRKSKR